MKKITLLLLIALVSNKTTAQNNDELDYILMEDQDTTFCIITEIYRSAGNVYSMEYYDLDKQKHSIRRKEVKYIKSIRVAGRTMDYIPLKASKPKSYQRHIEKIIDGKIKVYDHIRLIAKTDKNGKRQLYSVVGAGARIYTIKLPNGNYYKINSSDLKKFVVPYMLECKKFKNSFGEPITIKNIEDAVVKYNLSCK